jgi:hypothetical protein
MKVSFVYPTGKPADRRNHATMHLCKPCTALLQQQGIRSIFHEPFIAKYSLLIHLFILNSLSFLNMARKVLSKTVKCLQTIPCERRFNYESCC